MMLTPEQLAEWRDYVRTAKDTLVPMTKYELCSVLNHIDAQQARIAELDGLLTSASNHCNATANERNELRGRVVELEQDAARYRKLRLGQHWSVIDGIGDTLRADELDSAIDAAMQK